jgi:hypothetical protein
MPFAEDQAVVLRDRRDGRPAAAGGVLDLGPRQALSEKTRDVGIVLGALGSASIEASSLAVVWVATLAHRSPPHVMAV